MVSRAEITEGLSWQFTQLPAFGTISAPVWHSRHLLLAIDLFSGLSAVYSSLSSREKNHA